MKIGFNIDKLKDIGNNDVKIDKDGKVGKIVFDEETKKLFKKLRENNHESYVFITLPKETSLKEKIKIKKKLFKQYNLDKKYQPRIVIIKEDDYNNALKRNCISIEVGNDSTLTTAENMCLYVEEQIKDMEQPILSADTKSCGVPSEDKFWLKYQNKESYKLQNDFKSPYERIISGNIDFLDEDFIFDSNFGTKMSYKEVFEKADELCNAFLANGIKKGSKVPLILTSTPEMFITILALFKAKATIVPLFPKSTENEIKKKLESIDYDYMVVNDLFYKSVKNSIKPGSKAIVLPAANSANIIKKMYFNKVLKPKLGCEKIEYNSQFIDYNEFIEKSPKYNGVIDTSYDEDYEAVLLFTGGTVKSKGVILTAKNLESAFHGYPIANYPVLRDDKFACFLPINHVFGLVSIVYSASAYGGKLSTMLKIDLKKMHEMFLKDNITIFAGIPTMVDAIINSKELKSKELKDLRYFILGGAKTVEQVRRNVEKFGLEHGCDLKTIDGVGQTEISTGYIYNNVLSIKDSVKIVDTETGEELGYNQIGEICVSGPNVMKGYINKEDNINALETDKEGNVWFHTNDLGYNKDGKIYLTGRLNRRIKVNGELICVEDLEEVISQFEPIKECCVVGKTDMKKECVPVVFITLKEGYKYDESIKQSIENYYSKNIVYYSRPAITTCLSEIPRTAVGKPDFKQLQLLADCMDMKSGKTKMKIK